jgi:hypothetical protein
VGNDWKQRTGRIKTSLEAPMRIAIIFVFATVIVLFLINKGKKTGA